MLILCGTHQRYLLKKKKIKEKKEKLTNTAGEVWLVGLEREKETSPESEKKKRKKIKKDTSSERHAQSPERDPKMVEERVL